MAFQAPNAGQERQNRKILEQLEEHKKRLRMQTSSPGVPAGQTPSAVAVPPAVSQGIAGGPSGEGHNMTAAQRTALQHAHANSVGYFITQDSSFGNLILPVLPRFDKP